MTALLSVVTLDNPLPRAENLFLLFPFSPTPFTLSSLHLFKVNDSDDVPPTQGNVCRGEWG